MLWLTPWVYFFFFFGSSYGQAPVLCQMPELIGEAMLKKARSGTGFPGNEHELVFSDESEVEGKTFWPGELLSYFISLSSFRCVFPFIFVLVCYYSTCPQPPYSPTTTTSVMFSHSHPHVPIASSWVESCPSFFRVRVFRALP